MSGKYDYIFIDEIPKVQDIYYKFFIYLKRANPNIKFIIAGDCEQLLPAKDRVTQRDYKSSLALHESCDGNQFQLTKCRRSDDILLNMRLPEILIQLIKAHLAIILQINIFLLQTKKRTELNKRMMEQVVKQKRKCH